MRGLQQATGPCCCTPRSLQALPDFLLFRDPPPHQGLGASAVFGFEGQARQRLGGKVLLEVGAHSDPLAPARCVSSPVTLAEGFLGVREEKCPTQGLTTGTTMPGC